MKRAFKVVGVLVAILGVAWLGLDLWGRSRLAEYGETWRKEIAAERERVKALRQPVLRGEPIEENAFLRYRPLLKRTYDPTSPNPKKIDQPALNRAITAGVAGPMPPEAQSLLEAARPDVAALRQALRCNRADWEVDWEKGPAAEIPSLFAARVLAQLTVLEGFERARAGDLKGAAEHDLDTMRFGGDFAGSGVLIMDLIGIAIHRIGLDALSALVTTRKPADLPLAQIEAELARLEPAVPTVVNGMRGERLMWGFLTREIPSASEFGADFRSTPWQTVLFYLVPKRALAAHALSEMEPLLRDAERAVSVDDPAEQERVGSATAARVASTWNPIVSIAMPSLLRARVSADEERARFRMLVTAVKLEQARVRDRKYPPELADLPVDPFGYPAKLHYQPASDGTGYKLWSVGIDRKDQGGQATGNADIVLERKP